MSWRILDNSSNSAWVTNQQLSDRNISNFFFSSVVRVDIFPRMRIAVVVNIAVLSSEHLLPRNDYLVSRLRYLYSSVGLRHNESNSNAFRLASIVTLLYLLVLFSGVWPRIKPMTNSLTPWSLSTVVAPSLQALGETLILRCHDIPFPHTPWFLSVSQHRCAFSRLGWLEYLWPCTDS